MKKSLLMFVFLLFALIIFFFIFYNKVNDINIRRDISKDINSTEKLHTHKNADIKVISLAPFLTQMIMELGACEQLIAKTKWDFERCSKEEIVIINSEPNFNIEKIFNLKPDLLIVQESLYFESSYKRLEELGIFVLRFKNESLLDMNKNLLTLGDIVHKGLRAKFLIEKFAKDIRQISNLLQEQGVSSKKILILINEQSLYSPGLNTFYAEIFRELGLINISRHNGYKEISFEYIFNEKPDLIWLLDGQKVNLNSLLSNVHFNIIESQEGHKSSLTILTPQLFILDLMHFLEKSLLLQKT